MATNNLLLGLAGGGTGTATRPPGINPAPAVPGQSDTFNQLSAIVPGLTDLTKSGTDVISQMLSGLPSPSQTRTANAYFGINSGVPGSDFIRNRGYDIYGQQAQQRQQTGLSDLLSFLGSYSGFVPSPGQNLQTGLGYAQLGQGANEFNSQQAFNQWLQNQRLGLDWASLASQFGNN